MCDRRTVCGRVAHHNLTTRRSFRNAHVIYQLECFARQNALVTPLWLTVRHATSLRLRLAYATSPLNVWQPLCGDCFVPFARRHMSLAPPPPPDTRDGGGRIRVLARGCGGVPRWWACPRHMRSLFLRPRSARGGHLWVSQSLLPDNGGDNDGGVSAAADAIARVSVHTPYCAWCLFCVDQLAPCAALSELVADGYRDAAAAAACPSLGARAAALDEE